MRKIDLDNFSRATRDTPRDINRRIILNLLRESGPLSRAELSRRMKVPRGMITSLVNDLLEEGFVIEGTTTTAPRGRRPTLLHLRSHDRLAVGVELRANRTTVQLSDFGGTELARETFETPDTPETFVELLGNRIAHLLAPGERSENCEGVGIVVPGMVDGPTGRILDAPTLGWKNVDIRSALERRLCVDVRLERDAVACALATVWHGDPSAAVDNFVYMIVSTGVGTGLVIHNQPVRGRHFSAGEFGHVSLDRDGPRCSCGSRGCLEAYTSDIATVARYLGVPFEGRDTLTAVRRSGVGIADVVQRAVEGDPVAVQAIEGTAEYLGRGVAAIVKALDPARIVIGGEIVGAWPLVEPVIREQLARQPLAHAFVDTVIDVDDEHHETYLKGASALIVAPAFAAPTIA